MDALSRFLAQSRMGVSLDVQCRLSGPYVVPHEALAHGEAPFHLVLSGACQLRTAQGVVHLEPGDFVLLPHGDAHEVLSPRSARKGHHGLARVRAMRRESALPLKGNVTRADSAELDLLCGRFLCDPAASLILLRALPSLMQVNLLEVAEGATLRSLIDLLRHEAAHALPGASEIVNAVGQAVLTLALREFGKAESSEAHLLTLLSDERLAASVNAMLQDPSQDWTVESLGERAAMSRATYARQFQNRAGMPVGDFLLRVRMMRACELLRRSRRGLADIGQSVGYQSEAAFGKAFQRILGETPGRWRRAQRAQ